jgi:hypothetical protein
MRSARALVAAGSCRATPLSSAEGVLPALPPSTSEAPGSKWYCSYMASGPLAFGASPKSAKLGFRKSKSRMT